MGLFRAPKKLGGSGYLTGQMLIAMPTMPDNRFARSLIYVCAHSDRGAMGLVVNKPVSTQITFRELLRQLAIPFKAPSPPVPVQYGGPMEMGRGFVLHSSDYKADSTTLDVSNNFRLTATIDILKDLAAGDGPEKAMVALGYAGWDAGQLEGEIHKNGWLNCDADNELLFGPDLDRKWHKAIKKLGVDLAKLSDRTGHA